ncbi:MAG: hypothetical protein K2X60_12220 [Xanthobacteraceae bacterium]|nr:hypothetical protein [Xanthobacteraceae bacterium]
MIRTAKRAHASVLATLMQVLVVAQRDEVDRAIAAIDSGLHAQHTSATAAVVARFADRRAALSMLSDPAARAAAAHRLAEEERAELVHLALTHAAEKRRSRQSVVSSLAATHRSVRRALHQSQRHQRMGVAVQLHRLRPHALRTGKRTFVAGPRTTHWRRPPGAA